MSIRRVVPDLPAGDPAAAARFYTELLGFELVMDQGWVVTVASPANPTAQVTLVRPEGLQPELSIEVEDVDAVHAAAQARGEEIVYPLTDEPWGVRRFFVRDPAGHVVNVVSHR
ncbi:VOC family protein [Nonomuraea sp. NPDC050328]|uniref:VOC family protein n=1 Tax=Nonomuraea sp. NPDC050328 TaxID=3364361 RepID=UPI0037BAE222